MPRVRKRSSSTSVTIGRPRVPGRRVEHGQEAARDEVEDAALVGRERVDVVRDVGRDDRVVVVDLRVVDHSAERKLLEAEDEAGRAGVLLDRLEGGRGRLELRHEVAGEPARARARVRDRLLALVERLRGLERPPRREPEAAVRVALERGEVVEERRTLGLLLALDRLDDAVLARDLRRDRVGPLAVLQPNLVALEPEPLVARVEARVDEPVRLRHERLDLALALDDHRQRRRLHPAERDDAADPGAAADRRRARRVHADEPVRLGARAGGGLQRPELVARPQALEALADRGLRHRRDPEPLDRLVDAWTLVDVREDQLALTTGVAGVDDALDRRRALSSLWIALSCFSAFLSRGCTRNSSRDDRQVGHAPLLEASRRSPRG